MLECFENIISTLKLENAAVPATGADYNKYKSIIALSEEMVGLLKKCNSNDTAESSDLEIRKIFYKLSQIRQWIPHGSRTSYV